MKGRLMLGMWLLLLVCMFADAGAESTEGQKRCGDYWYKIRQDGTAEIVLYAGGKKVETELIIPDSLDGYEVTAIGEDCFWGASISLWTYNVETLIIPDTVVCLGNRSLGGFDRNLKEIIIGKSVRILEGNPFSWTKSESVKISPENTELEFKDNALFLKSEAKLICAMSGDFSHSAASGHYDVPEGTRIIGDGAFSGMNFRSITLPQGLKEIGKKTFQYCFNLEEIIIPSSVCSIVGNPFVKTHCRIILEDGENSNFEVRENALFEKNSKKLICYLGEAVSSYRVPEGTVCIADAAFCEAGVQEIIIPDSVTEIHSGAFDDCVNLFKIYGTIYMEGSSMMDTFSDGDELLLSIENAGRAVRGDIVLCTYPNRNDERFVKRVVAVPGDTVYRRNGVTHVVYEIVNEDGESVIVDDELDAQFAGTFYNPNDDYEAYVLNDNEYFVVGDNRGNSHDSRDWKDGDPSRDIGPIQVDMIIGHIYE